MDNDLNTSLAITSVYDVLKEKTNDATKRALLADFDRVLALGLLEEADAKRKADAEKSTAAESTPDVEPELDAKIRAMIEERAAAKKAKDYARADEIRTELTNMGVILKDTKEGTTYTMA